MASSAKKKNSAQTVKRLRAIGLGFLALLATGFLVSTFYFGTGLSQNSVPEAGTDYEVVDGVFVDRPAQTLSVEEYFSYACIHCKNFDPELVAWVATLDEDVVFRRVPAAFSRAWSVLAQGYYALEKADALAGNHQQIFKAIHNGRRVFNTGQDMADYLDSNELSAEDFMRAFNSRDVSRKLARAASNTQRYNIRAVPTLVVAGKYQVGLENGAARALQVTDYLLEQERKLQQSQTP
jgi:thiol:disulfide interchange protein DsbA